MLRVRCLPSTAIDEPFPGATHQVVVARVLDQLARAGYTDGRLLGCGHRVVHGGERFSNSIRVDDAVFEALRSFCHLAPLHNPANMAGIEAVGAVLPDLPQVAVFDTAFHHTMPATPFVTRYPRSGTRNTVCDVTGSTASVTASSASRLLRSSAGRWVSSA
jgi:acetate kinase